MTKQGVAIVFILSGLVCLFSVFMCWNSKSRYRIALFNVAGAGTVTTFVYALTLILNTYPTMKIAYGFYFFSMDWLCASMFFFMLSYSYSNLKRETIRKIAYAMIPVLAVDSLWQIVNIWTNNSVRYEITYLKNGDLLLKFLPQASFQFHLGICYTLVLAGIMLLVIKTISSSNIYRTKYLSILSQLIIIVLFNVFFMIGKFEIDFSILGYSLCSILLVFYTIHLMPHQLTNHVAGSLVTFLNSQVYVYDENGDRIFENDLAKKVSQIDVKTLKELMELLRIPLQDTVTERREEITYVWDNKEYSLDVRYQTMREEGRIKKSRVVGTYVLIEDITQQKKEQEEKEYRATHDLLTGFYNRDYFTEKATELIQRDPATKYAVAMTNINQFTLYNEVFGKKAGDKLLIDIADSFRQNVDIDNIVYGRYEADRFVSCLPLKKCNLDVIKMKGVDEPVYINNFNIINYVGVCPIEDKNEKIDAFCERAAIALTTIKGDAKLRIAYYDPVMKEKLMRERELVASFPIALEKKEIQIYIQPQVNQSNGNVVGGEALVRWWKDNTLISPGEFVPILENNGLITEMDQAVWRMASELIHNFREKGMNISVSVNISTQDFYRLDLYQVFTDLIREYQIPAHSLKLEITESNFLKNLETHIIVMSKLQEEGFVIEMDDFGSGYSSLNSLKDIPVNVLKMDLKFLEKLETRKRGQIIIQNVIRLSEDLGITLITEGVETKEQAEIIKRMGCSYIQGYYFGRPMPIPEFEKYCEQRNYEDLRIHKV